MSDLLHHERFASTESFPSLKASDSDFKYSAKIKESEMKELSKTLLFLWNQLNVDEKYQEYFRLFKVENGNISLEEIKAEISRIENALSPVPIKRWPSSPSERFREAQRLFSNLDTFWDFYRISEIHRTNFKTAHKNLDINTLGQIWEEHEMFRKLTLKERGHLSEQAEQAKASQIVTAIREARSLLTKMWIEMKIPADNACDIVRVDIRPEHLTLENVEFHEVAYDSPIGMTIGHY